MAWTARIHSMGVKGKDSGVFGGAKEEGEDYFGLVDSEEAMGDVCPAGKISEGWTGNVVVVDVDCEGQVGSLDHFGPYAWGRSIGGSELS